MVKPKNRRKAMMVKSNGVFDSKFFMCLVLMVSEGAVTQGVAVSVSPFLAHQSAYTR